MKIILFLHYFWIQKIKLDPGQYTSEASQWKGCKLKPGKVPIGSRCGLKMTQREYNRLIGNVVSNYIC